MAAQGKVSGRLVVVILFTTAVLMWGIVFMVGLRQRGGRDGSARGALSDSTVTVDQVRGWLKARPQTWVKVSRIEGQGYVLYVPCYSPNGSLTLRTAPDSAPGLACEYCDSLGEYAVRSIVRTFRDSVWELRLDPPAGRVRMVPVNDSLLKRFPEAPFKETLLIWTRERAEGRIDTMLFVPKSQESEFETLRAEDENPEGCGGGSGVDPD